jgi:ABC-2 type transport system ATP-binding protein
MIRIEQLTKRYGDTTVLNIPEMDIPKGQVFGLVGNNGAGKTTLFSLLLDLIQATEGTVMIDQVDVSASEDWKTNTAAFLDDSFLIGYLTPEEYFYFIGELRNVSKQGG